MDNFESWIEDNAFLEDHGWDDLCVTVEAIYELLKTHAIVPREPTHKILESMESIVRDECKDHGWASQQYKLAIEGAENDKS